MSRYVPEKLAGVDQAAAAFEGEIHELIRRDAAVPSRQRSEEMRRLSPRRKHKHAHPARLCRVDGGN